MAKYCAPGTKKGAAPKGAPPPKGMKAPPPKAAKGGKK